MPRCETASFGGPFQQGEQVHEFLLVRIAGDKTAGAGQVQGAGKGGAAGKLAAAQQHARFRDARGTGYNKASFTPLVSSAMIGAEYYFRVWNEYGSVDSETVILSLDKSPVITVQPEDAVAKVGSRASFTVEATGENLQYQWYYRLPGGEWVNSHGTNYNKATFTPLVSSSMIGAEYYCCVWNEYGTVNSKTVQLLSSNNFPVITVQPEDVVAKVGTTVTFSVEATGSDLQYCWYYRLKDSDSWRACSKEPGSEEYSTGATHRQYVFDTMNGAEFMCTVSSGEHVITSNAAMLTVVP